jgi:hypothetical protein
MKNLAVLMLVLASFAAGGLVVYVAMRPTPQRVTSDPVPLPADTSTNGASQPVAGPVVPPVMPVLLPDPAEAAEVADALRTVYVDAPLLLKEDLGPGRLPEVFARLGTRVKIAPAPKVPAAGVKPPKAEWVADGIGYWRLRSLSPRDVSTLLKAWEGWKGAARGMILDLRDFETPNAFDPAADLAGMWVSPGTPLFTVQGLKVPQKVYVSQRQPLERPLRFPLVVLVNEGTSGAAEALVRILQARAGAIVMGRPTAGEAGLTAESRLSSGRYLRVATAEVVSAAGDKWLGIPVQPDIVVVDDRAREAAALEQGYLQGAATVIREVAVRRQTNEASLVREENVEIEEMIAAQKEQAGTGPAPEIRDLTLQRAVDVVRGILASLTPPEIPAP